MPCKEAMIKHDVISATSSTTVAEVIDLFDEHSIRSVPVIDESEKLVGLFNFRKLLITILPTSVNLGDDIKQLKHFDLSLDHVTGQSEWVAGRLKDNLDRPLSEVMITDPAVVHHDTPLREGVRLLAQHGSPLPVVDEETGKLVGLISSQSVLTVLLKMKTHLKRGLKVEDFNE